MKILKQFTPWIIIIVLLLLLVTKCDKDPVVKSFTKTHTDTLKIHHTDTINIFKNSVHTKLKLDTVYIINDSVKEYQFDVVEKDLMATVCTQSTGRLISQTMDYSIMYTTIINSDTIKIKQVDSVFTEKLISKNLFFAGTDLHYNKGVVGAGLNLSWQTKSYYQFSVGYNFLSNKLGLFTMGVKIPLNKH